MTRHACLSTGRHARAFVGEAGVAGVETHYCTSAAISAWAAEWGCGVKMGNRPEGWTDRSGTLSRRAVLIATLRGEESR